MLENGDDLGRTFRPKSAPYFDIEEMKLFRGGFT